MIFILNSNKQYVLLTQNHSIIDKFMKKTQAYLSFCLSTFVCKQLCTKSMED